MTSEFEKSNFQSLLSQIPITPHEQASKGMQSNQSDRQRLGPASQNLDLA